MSGCPDSLVVSEGGQANLTPDADPNTDKLLEGVDDGND